MEDRDTACSEVVECSASVLEVTVRPSTDRVDREVATGEVCFKVRELDRGQGTRRCVNLGTGPRDIDPDAVYRRPEGAETLVFRLHVTDQPRKSVRIVGDDDVELSGLQSEQDVSDSAPDEPGATVALQRTEHRRASRRASQPLRELWAIEHGSIVARIGGL